MLTQGQCGAEWPGIHRALNGVVHLLSVLTLIPAKSVRAGTILPSLLSPNKCLSTVFFDKSQTKGRRSRKERKSRYQEIPEGLIEMIQVREKKVGFRVEQGEAGRGL